MLQYDLKSHLFLMHAAKKYLEATDGVFITILSVASVKPSGGLLVRMPNQITGGLLKV
jgi:hypothetical protein